jgi:hypothetical protein
MKIVEFFVRRKMSKMSEMDDMAVLLLVAYHNYTVMQAEEAIEKLIGSDEWHECCDAQQVADLVVGLYGD